MSWLLVIDVGTSSTVAAVVEPGGEPHLLSFGDSALLPSGVLVDDRGNLLVGHEAARLVGSAPERYERSPKRRLGDQTMLLGGHAVDPIDALAALLRHVLEIASQSQGGPPDALRMTVPARWGTVRRTKLGQAAIRAGLPSPVLIDEPVAATLFAAEPGLAPGAHVAIYDLGGGTVDTAVLRRTASGFEVVGAPGGNDQLGGELFDDLLYGQIGNRIEQAMPDVWEQLVHSDERPWRRLSQDLRDEARRAKEALSSASDYDLYLGAPLDMQGRVTRDELETLIRPDVQRSVDELAATIHRAGITPSDLSRVYAVGGATRTPLVIRLLAEELGSMPVTWGDPKAAVVLGAALPGMLGTPLGAAPSTRPTPPIPSAADRATPTLSTAPITSTPIAPMSIDTSETSATAADTTSGPRSINLVALAITVVCALLAIVFIIVLVSTATGT